MVSCTIKINTSFGEDGDYWASVSYKGEEYRTDIPFSYDTLDYKFSLAELLSDYTIPNELKGFVNNLTLVNFYIARFSRRASMEPDSFFWSYSPQVFEIMAKYEEQAMYED